MNERGSAPIWFLGLSICVLMVGALSAELWRIIGERQELVAIADAAAVAAAAVVDPDAYRANGEIRIDEDEGTLRALAVIAGHSGGEDLSMPPMIVVSEDGSSVSVTVTREVAFGLLRILALDDDRFEVTGQAVAYPRTP